jgi:hypothetical protein
MKPAPSADKKRKAGGSSGDPDGRDGLCPAYVVGRPQQAERVELRDLSGERNVGNIHPAQALRQYRSEFGGDAQAVVVGMTSIAFTQATSNRIVTPMKVRAAAPGA